MNPIFFGTIIVVLGSINSVLHHLASSYRVVSFSEAEVNTQPNRYLMIATSGGLNQQRTGVRFRPREAFTF